MEHRVVSPLGKTIKGTNIWQIKIKMADKHTLNYDVRELKLGSSFTNNKSSQYHTIKYDFKPASVDVNKMATVDVGTNNQVTVTVPHLDGAGVPQTVFKGSQRPYTKECVLIIDRVTGEITLEKLSSNIQVKKTRQETSQKPRPLTPVTTDFTNTTQRSSSRTRVATNRRTANNTGPSGVQTNTQNRFNNSVPKSQNMVRSPTRVKTSPPQAPWSGGGNSTLASLPMIGIGFDEAPPRSPPAPPALPAHAPRLAPPPPLPTPQPPAAVSRQDDSSSSSSSDSDSDSASGSDSDDDAPAPPALPALPAMPAMPAMPALSNGVSNAGLPSDVLNDDLCLSESGSDSD
ncbi:unnamed protein product, partial [Brenthis ino]